MWLKAALHTHTNRTDGDLSPDAHVLHHEWMGFDVVAITDHWTLTSEPSTDRILVIQGAELAVDPLAKGRYTEILAIGIDDIPEDPGGDRDHWEQVENYHFKTFPDLSTAAANITAQGGVAFVAHPYWSGLPPETVLEARGVAGFELYNASAERETGRGDSSYIWDLALDRGQLLFGIATDDCHYPGFDIGDGWTMVRAARSHARGRAGSARDRLLLRLERSRDPRRPARRRRDRGAVQSRGLGDPPIGVRTGVVRRGRSARAAGRGAHPGARRLRGDRAREVPAAGRRPDVRPGTGQRRAGPVRMDQSDLTVPTRRERRNETDPHAAGRARRHAGADGARARAERDAGRGADHGSPWA